MRTSSAQVNNAAVVNSFIPGDVAGQLPARLCERLARSHYENFPVGSVFLPAEMRRDVYNIYAYCRICDDLGDETGDPQLSLRLLQWWRSELHDCFRGQPKHPIFVALKTTIDKYDMPIEPFDDLISAFVQDQTVTRYESFESLLDYCSRSANPVGRIFLWLMGYRDPQRRQLSDCTCTALQLANFWQDIPTDYRKGRIYIPQEDMKRFGYTEFELRNGVLNTSFIKLMQFQIARTRELFEQGSRLSRLISGPGSAEVALFNKCGVAVLDQIEKNHYAVFRRHIKVPKIKKLMLALGWAFAHTSNIIRKD